MTALTLPSRPTAALLLMLLLPLAAAAHPGADAGQHHALQDGLLHPLGGADHWLVMLAVGLWSAGPQRDRQLPIGLAPLAFALLLGAGAALAARGLWPAPMFDANESLIAASLLVMGLLLALRQGLPAAASVALVGGFALAHGAAHGAELGAGPALWGMLITSASLHLAGLGLGLWARRLPGRWSALPRWAGAAIALSGTGLLLA